MLHLANGTIAAENGCPIRIRQLAVRIAGDLMAISSPFLPQKLLQELPKRRIVSSPVQLKKQLGNRETILPVARKKAEAFEA